jgi:hypothetical protein
MTLHSTCQIPGEHHIAYMQRMPKINPLRVFVNHQRDIRIRKKMSEKENKRIKAV